MAGRRPKSREQKKLSGTLQPCRDNIKPISLKPLQKIPNVRSYMNKYAIDIYKTTAQSLLENGLLNHANLPIVRAYACELGRYEEALEKISDGTYLIEIKDSKDRLVRVLVDPLVKMAPQNLNTANRLAIELGLTPASSSKVPIMPKIEEDPFENL